MKYILISILFLFLYGCQEMEKNKPDTYKTQTVYFDTYNNNVEVATIVIDSCEYLYAWFGASNGGGSFTHKGNCRFCIERNKKMLGLIGINLPDYFPLKIK